MHKQLTEKPKPTLDPQHLQHLAEEASPAIAESFAKDYSAARGIQQHLPRLQDTLARRPHLALTAPQR